jgi:alpha-tubulin suppressor-like RCC1 family protein
VYTCSSPSFLLNERNRHGPTLLNHVANSSWIEVACGDHHTVALSRNGEVHTWGNGMFGQLGHGDNNSTNIPTRVESLLCGVTVIKVNCGEYHTAVITKEGVLLTWYVHE